MSVRIVEVHWGKGAGLHRASWQLVPAERSALLKLSGLGSRQAGLSETLDGFDDTAKTVAAIGREVLCDADFTEEFGIGGNDFFRLGIAVKIAKQFGDAFDDRRVRFRTKEAAAVFKFGDDPELRHATLDFKAVDA